MVAQSQSRQRPGRGGIGRCHVVCPAQQQQPAAKYLSILARFPRRSGRQRRLQMVGVCSSATKRRLIALDCAEAWRCSVCAAALNEREAAEAAAACPFRHCCLSIVPTPRKGVGVWTCNGAPLSHGMRSSVAGCCKILSRMLVLRRLRRCGGGPAARSLRYVTP
ncbi:hypothetical protein BC567DRAFT_215225 [Phyllosticta citribraziliensis]